MSNELESARVRWLVLGAFSQAPSGERFHLEPGTLDKAFAAAELRFSVKVPDRLGAAGGERTVIVAPRSLKDLTQAALIAADPGLSALKALGEDLGSGDAAKRPTAEAALARIVEAVGDGALAAEARSALGLAAAAPAPAPAAGDAADKLFAQAEAPATGDPAKRAVTAFVASMRPGGPAPAQSSGARKLRDAIEVALYATAREVLADRALAALEGNWRGLQHLSSECPKGSGLAIEVVDAPSSGVEAVLEADPPADPSERYDAFFVVDPIDSPERLLRVARAAELALAPAVVSVSHALFGHTAAGAVAAGLEADGGHLPESFHALTADESSRWLCLALNRPVVGGDGAGQARRVALGSPSLFMAGLLSASYRVTGSFARLLGASGGWKAPATTRADVGRQTQAEIPTEAFYSINAQTRAASFGLLALGSGRDADKVMLSTMPTARTARDAFPLAAQLLCGRIVRFAQWVRDQVPEGATTDDVRTLFVEAARVFLFPSLAEGGAVFDAEVVEHEGKREVRVGAQLKAEHAGVPLQLAFGLPL